MKALRLATLLLALALPQTAAAGALADLILKGGVLAELPQGESLTYAFNRRLPAGDPNQQGAASAEFIKPHAVIQGEAKLTAKPEGLVLSLTESAESAAQDKASFSPQGANPMLLFFLENVVRNVAAHTGGSPFYIRNRIRDALVAEDLSGEATATVEITPFEGDANAPRLGPFADLTLTITLDPSRPGHLLDLKAETPATPDGYLETMTLKEGM